MTDKDKAAIKLVAEGLAAATGKTVRDMLVYGEKYGPDLVIMMQEGATDADLRVPARVLVGELAVKGINLQAAGERGLKAAIVILRRAGMAALGL